jgi:dTDP-4-amino-4,6-dideoxygalactose transaminase
VVRSDNRDQLKKDLAQRGIATTLNYPRALPFYPAYSYLNHQPSDFPIAHTNQSRILSLPIYPEMTGEMIEFVAAEIAAWFDAVEVSA